MSCWSKVARNRTAVWTSAALIAWLIIFAAAAAYRFWPRCLPLPSTAYPSARIENGRMIAPFPARFLLARVGRYDDQLSAYLWFDYLRSRPALRKNRVFIVSSEPADRAGYEIFVQLPNDALGSVALLSSLEAKGYIDGFTLQFSSHRQTDQYEDQTRVFIAAYRSPTCATLEALSFEQLQPSVARFLVFKSRTDARTQPRANPRRPSLNDREAREVAADIIAVAKFYDLPLDAFLGVGAIENNYLAVDGDLQHAVWKPRPGKGDIVLERKRHKALVSDYSMGAWQISRETLRRAHRLYLRDNRDYAQLPERLRPAKVLNFDSLDSHVMTTYAGLLLRDLLDRFDGNVARAVGAYNGGPRRPNPRYSASVHLIAAYARNILQCGAATQSESLTANLQQKN